MDKKSFDLTTNIGKKVALSYLRGGPMMLAFSIIKEIISSIGTREQGKVVEQLIKSGKEQGVDEMEIKVKNTKGLDFSAPFEGIDIKLMVGSKEDTIVKVKYK